MSATPRFRWPTLFQECDRPIFVLNASKRLRFVNAAWEQITGESSAEALGKACLRKGPTESLYRTLAPPRDLKVVSTVRRSVPPQSNGPPWWDVTFFKLTTADGGGFLGMIDVVAASPGQPAKSVSPFLGGLRKSHAEQFTRELFAGNSPEMKRFQHRLIHAAESTAPVWLIGEPGSGKSMAARVIHHTGPRREMPFVRLDGAAIQPYLLDAILFGSGGLAEKHRIGTLHLANPQALPRDTQNKLSDWLLHAPNAPRVIGSSEETPVKLASDGALRPEFACELAVIEMRLPPLRERLDELPRLIARFLPSDEVEESIYPILRAHHWPGNLSELGDVLRKAIECGRPLVAANLPRTLREKALSPFEAPAKPRPDLDSLLESVEKNLLLHAMKECRGNPTAAAERLGIARTRLLRRFAALGLSPPMAE